MPKFLTSARLMASGGGDAITGAGLKPKVVTELGAVADGVTDDAPAIQAVLDAGGTVIFPPGVYRLASVLRVYQNTNVVGMPGATLKRGGNTALITNGDATQNFGGYTGHGNIFIEGFTFDMNPVEFPAYDCAISIGHARGVTIRDCTVLDVPGYHAIEINSTKGCLIENCNFLGFTAVPGERGFSEAVQFDLAKSSGVFGWFGPYDHTPCEDVTMRGCYVGASDNFGAWPRGVGSHSATIGVWHSRVRIKDNSFEGCLSWAISTYTWRDVVISDNQMQDCGGGIRLETVDPADVNDTKDTAGNQTGGAQNCEVFMVAGNTIRGTTGTAGGGILVNGVPEPGLLHDVVVDNNVIHNVNNLQPGIKVVNTERYNVTNNMFKDIDGIGISLDTAHQGSICGNNVHVTTNGSGIAVIGCNDLAISGNQLAWLGENGFWSQSSTGVVLAANHVMYPARRAPTTGPWYGFRITTNCDGFLIQGNRARNYSSGGQATNGISITSSCSNMRMQDNDLVGSGSSGALSDASTAVTGKSGGNWLT